MCNYFLLKKIYYYMKILKKMLILFLLFCPIIVFGCSNNIDLIVQENLSEVRYNLFVAGNEEINVKFTSGFREDPYVLNGKSENKKEFGVITVKFLKNISNKNATPNFVITISDMDFDGELELNPFDQTYVQDIETFVLDASSVSIKISFGDFCFESNLKNVSNDFAINHKDALNIFVKEYKKDIQTLSKNGKDFEVYVKIINDPSLEIDKNYFYVCLLSSSGESFSLMIDPYSANILAKNESKNQILL